MKTWLKWLGDKHQQLKDWSENYDSSESEWKRIFRIAVFYSVDTLIILAATLGLVFLVLAIFGKFINKTEE